jgi:uncharacterized RDD family membrane protein YckC
MARSAVKPADYAAFHREQERRVRRTLVTPEGVDLSLRIADAGQRAAAFILDFLIIILGLVALTLIAVLLLFAGGLATGPVAVIIWLLGWFVLRNFYFVMMEMGPRAATFGKRIIGVRVVARSGARLTADAVIARNLMREVEFYLPISFLIANAAQDAGDSLATLAGLGWTGIFLFFPLFNRDRLRAGDLLAGTWVVQTPRRSLGRDLIGGKAVQSSVTFTDEQLDVYGAFELQTLEQVLRNGRPDAMDNVANAIRGKIDGWNINVSNPEFLNAYYEALRNRLERKLLFGKRRLDKYDQG